MTIRTLYIGSKNYDFSKNNKDISIFLNSKNLQSVINSDQIYDCNSSIEDIGCENISFVIDSVSKIEFLDIDENYIVNLHDCNSFDFFNFIKLASESNKLVNSMSLLEPAYKKLNELVAERKNNEQVLWTAGCSFTYGVGVELTERYGYHLSSMLNLEELMLARPGASISWAADQLLRSDIKANDIIVWGITNSCRVDVNCEFSLISVTSTSYPDYKNKFFSIDYFDSLSLGVSNYRKILQVINFCKKIGAKLYIINLLDHGMISLFLRNYEYFLDLSVKYDSKDPSKNYLDYGQDGSHPGPKQHVDYANKIFEFIKKCNL